MRLPHREAAVELEGTFQAQDAVKLIGALSLVSLTMIFTVLYSRDRSTVLSLTVCGKPAQARFASTQ